VHGAVTRHDPLFLVHDAHDPLRGGEKATAFIGTEIRSAVKLPPLLRGAFFTGDQAGTGPGIHQGRALATVLPENRLRAVLVA